MRLSTSRVARSPSKLTARRRLLSLARLLPPPPDRCTTSRTPARPNPPRHWPSISRRRARTLRISRSLPNEGVPFHVDQSLNSAICSFAVPQEAQQKKAPLARGCLSISLQTHARQRIDSTRLHLRCQRLQSLKENQHVRHFVRSDVDGGQPLSRLLDLQIAANEFGFCDLRYRH